MNSVRLGQRARDVLGRFPNHWHAVEDDKLLAHVVSAIATNLDAIAGQIGRVRQAHRFGKADEWRDLLLFSGLHGLGVEHYQLLDYRLRLLAEVRTALSAGSDLAAAFQTLALGLGVPVGTLVRQPMDPRSDEGFRAALADAIGSLLELTFELEAMRTQISVLVQAHRAGNATPEHLLRAAAAYLHLEVRSVSHSQDRYWHLASCVDGFTLEVPGSAANGEQAALPGYLFRSPGEYLALEENPFEDAEREPVERCDGDRFTVVRHGFDAVQTRVHVVGIGDHCWGPMVVNLQTGSGLWFQSNVPDGQELVLGSDGSAKLGEEDVTEYVWSFRGGLFADAAATHESSDFVFADAVDGEPTSDRVATFVVSEPTNDAFDNGHAVPHVPGAFEPAELKVGTTRWAYFVQRGHFGARRALPLPDEPAVHLYHAGVFDYSVANPSDMPSARIGFSWRERQAFAVTLWVPERFQVLDGEATNATARTLERLLLRHRAAGVRLQVAYASDRWTLGEGILRDIESGEALGTALLGTRTWTDGTSQQVPT